MFCLISYVMLSSVIDIGNTGRVAGKDMFGVSVSRGLRSELREGEISDYDTRTHGHTDGKK